MKFGLAFATGGPAVTPDNLALIAQTAEQLGFESFWSTEHIAVPVDYDSTYPYADSGRIPVPADTPFPDPLIPLAFVAAITERIHLGTAAVILPEHEPLALAKAVANLDVLSRGRVELGVGVGWLREEYEAVGVDFTTRGKRMDALIPTLRKLWTVGPSTVETEFFAWSGIECNPKPHRPGGVPIHITGHSRAASRRTARLGDGFIPGVGTVEAFAETLDILDAECSAVGRDRSTIELTVGCNGGKYGVDDVRRLEDLGATRVHAAFWAQSAQEVVDAMTRYADEVMHVVGADAPAALVQTGSVPDN